MTRKIWTGAVAVAAVVLSQAAYAAGPTRYEILNNLYGAQMGLNTTNAATWDAYKVGSDKYWSADPPGSFPTVLTQVKYANGTSNQSGFILGMTNPAGGQYQVFGAMTGTSGALGSPNFNSGVTTYGLTEIPGFELFTLAGTSTQPNGTISLSPDADPWAWDVRGIKTPIDQTLKTAGYWQNYYSNPANTPGGQFTSRTNTPDSMVAYRLNYNGTTHWVFMWDTDGSIDDYNSLVLEVQGVKNPEPASMTLMGLGLAGLVGYGVRYVRRRKAAATAAETPAIA